MFEPTVTANGRLSEWSAEPILVPKEGSTSEWDEPRLAVHCRNVHETLSDINITYKSDVHERLAHPAICRRNQWEKYKIKASKATMGMSDVEVFFIFPQLSGPGPVGCPVIPKMVVVVDAV